MLNQLQCETLVCGIDKILKFGLENLDNFFKELQNYFFSLVRDRCQKHDVDCVICICEPNMDYIELKENGELGNIINFDKLDDETFLLVVYRDSKEL
jgi:hypothetical protein